MKGLMAWLRLRRGERTRDKKNQAKDMCTTENRRESDDEDDSSDGPQHYIPMPWRFR